MIRDLQTALERCLDAKTIKLNPLHYLERGGRHVPSKGDYHLNCMVGREGRNRDMIRIESHETYIYLG